MENSYGIAVTNKFELFLDEDTDPLEILKQTEESKKKEKDAKGKDAKSGKETKSAKNKQNKKVLSPVQSAPAEAAPVKKEEKQERPKGKPQNARGGFPNDRDHNVDRPPRGDRPPRDNGNRDRDLPPRRRMDRDDRTDRPQTGGGEFRDNRGRGGRGRGAGGRGGGFPGRGRGGFGVVPGADRMERTDFSEENTNHVNRGGRGGFNKREFERRSGSDKTGIKAVEKREGGGARNWGSFKDDMDEHMNDTTTSEENPEAASSSPDAKDVSGGEGKADADGLLTDEDGKENEEEAVKELTLDEYKAQLANSRTETKFNIRRAGEGVDDAQWKKTYVLKKATEPEESEEEDDDEEYEDERAHKKKLLNIEITFNDPSPRGARGGRRGGRGGPRGAGGRGGPPREDGGGPRGGGRGGFGDRPRRGGFGEDRRGGGGERGGYNDRRGSYRGNRGGDRHVPMPNVADEADFPSLSK